MENAEEKKERGLQHEIILLSQVPDIWRLANHLLDTEKGEHEGPVHAFHATFVWLKNLWYFHQNARLDKEWAAIRPSIALGLIKDTQRYGNTSVSMGAAKNKFRENPTSDSIGFLNCGTGGIKYQLYSSRGCLHLKSEHKPKNGALPSLLEIGRYKPANYGINNAQQHTIKSLAQELARELEHPDLPWAQERNIPVYAFLTGPLREHWERADGAEKQQLESKMRELFEPFQIKPWANSYFMSQDEEGTLELLGSQRMYANLVEAEQLETGTMVVGSLGIGKGSSQWMVQEVDGTMTLVGLKAGMTNVAKLAQLSQTLTENYQDPVKWKNFKQTFLAAGKGVIALKSGAALLIENKAFAALKAELVATPLYRKRTVRTTLEADRTHNGVGKVISYSWTGSLDRLCAEVQILFGAPHDLELIFREGEDGKFEEVPRNGEIREHELLYFAPRGLIPSAVVEPKDDGVLPPHPISPHPVILEPMQVGGISPTSMPQPPDVRRYPATNGDIGSELTRLCALM